MAAGNLKPQATKTRQIKSPDWNNLEEWFRYEEEERRRQSAAVSFSPQVIYEGNLVA